MENLGALAILLAFCFSLYAIAASVVGKLKANTYLVVSAERAVYGTFLLLTTASGLLIYALVAGDFRLASTSGSVLSRWSCLSTFV